MTLPNTNDGMSMILSVEIQQFKMEEKALELAFHTRNPVQS